MSARHENFVYWAIWAFVVAFVIVIAATAIAAAHEALASKHLPAFSAGFGVSHMQAGSARLGVGAPGTARNAVEFDLSDSPVSSPAPMRAPTAFGLCNGSARAPR